MGPARRVRVAAVLAAALTLVGVGCTGTSNDALQTADNGESAVRTGTPTKPVDQIRWYTFYRPVLGLQAATYADYPEMMVNANLCESVVRLEPDFSLKPGLTTFRVNSDSTVFTYTIRPGARFWDGSPVTPADIIFSIKANTTPPFGGQNAALGEEIKSIVQVGAETVRITLKAPDVIFNNQLASTAGKVYQKKHALAAGQHWGDSQGRIMCTGPYKLGEWDPANSLEIVRNDDYWGPDFTPLVRSIVFSWPQDPASLANSFRAGTLDGGWNLPPSILGVLQRSGAGNMYIGSEDTAVQLFGLIVGNTKVGKLADPRLRQAFSLAMNRAAIADKIYHGAADPAVSLVPAGAFAYERAAFEDAYSKISTSQDLDEAKRLIEATGEPAPTVTLALPAGDSLATTTATQIQADAAKAGFDVELRPMSSSDYAQLFADPETRKGVDLFFLIYAPPVRDPLVYFNDLINANGVYNYNGYSNAKVQALLAHARNSTDLSSRAQDVLAIQEQFLKDLPLIALAAPRVTVWQQDGITGAPTTFTYLQSPWAAMLGGE